MQKDEIADILKEIGVFLELKGENPFKTRAYQNGARTLESLTEPLAKLVEEERLGDIKGINTHQSVKDGCEPIAITSSLAILVLGTDPKRFALFSWKTFEGCNEIGQFVCPIFSNKHPQRSCEVYSPNLPQSQRYPRSQLCSLKYIQDHDRDGQCRHSLTPATSPRAAPMEQLEYLLCKGLRPYLKQRQRRGYRPVTCNGSAEQDGRHEVNRKCQLYRRSFSAFSFYLSINCVR